MIVTFRAAILVDVLMRARSFNLDPEDTATKAAGLPKLTAGRERSGCFRHGVTHKSRYNDTTL